MRIRISRSRDLLHDFYECIKLNKTRATLAPRSDSRSLLSHCIGARRCFFPTKKSCSARSGSHTSWCLFENEKYYSRNWAFQVTESTKNNAVFRIHIQQLLLLVVILTPSSLAYSLHRRRCFFPRKKSCSCMCVSILPCHAAGIALASGRVNRFYEFIRSLC